MTFFGIPAILSLIITLKVYADIARKFKELQRHFIVPNDIGVQKLFWYPAVIFLSCIPALVDNIVQIYFDFSLQSLNVIHVILFHSLGFSNALVYGLQRRKFEMNRNLPNRDSVTSTENQDRSLEDIETIEARIKRNSLDASLFKASVATPF